MKILVTAFEPFGGEKENSSLLALNALRFSKGAQLFKLILKTEFKASVEALKKELSLESFDAVLCLGQAGGRDALTPEKRAVNLMDAKIPDNACFQPQNTPIEEGGCEEYLSTLPIEEMAGAMSGAGIPSKISLSAGTFVCNTVMWSLLNAIKTSGMHTLGGFMHLPFATEQQREGYFSLPLKEIVKGVEISLEVIARALASS